MQNLGRLSEGKILSNAECVTNLCKNNYTSAPRTHLEPRDRSWQWSVRRGPELTKCKDLCVPKICPKKRFFPRFKKSYIPAEKRSCSPTKKKLTWKEYFSFLLPDPVPKPPLITCRKLQAQRRVCCGNPFECGAYCLRDNCCPVPKEWYGQAVVYDVPSSFPEPAVPDEPKPCAPPPPTEPASNFALTGACPEHKELNMEDYAYKKAFSGINVCDEIKNKPQTFKCKSVCIREPFRAYKQEKLTCGFSTEFKEVECPQPLAKSDIPEDIPPSVCRITHASKPPTKDINVEVKKGECERTTFLKPHKYGEKYPGMSPKRSFHTLKHSVSDNFTMLKSNYTAGPNKFPTVAEPSPASLSESSWVSRELPAFVQMASFYQPSMSSMSLHSVLTRPISGTCKESNMFFPELDSYRHYASAQRTDNYDIPDIDPKLLALAEETKKKIKYAEPPKNEQKVKAEPPLTLARKLSNEITQRMIKRAKDGIEENSPTRPIQTPTGRTKLSLLKKSSSPVTYSRANFMTNTTDFERKKQDNTKKKKVICSGCSGIREAEKEAECPTPKSFLDCKVRPAGRCRGPTKQLKPGEPEPNNPYYRNKAKPYSLCNKPRPIVKKKERGYKMPCEENQKRKFHTSTLISESAPSFVTISDFMRTKGISFINKTPNTKGNIWDSHTPDSYQETDMKGYDSVPDLGKFNREDAKPISMRAPYSGKSTRKHKQHILKMNSDFENQSDDSFSERAFNNPITKNDEWGYPPDSYCDNKTDLMATQETKTPKVETAESKPTGIKREASTINIWDPPGRNNTEEQKPQRYSNETCKNETHNHIVNNNNDSKTCQESERRKSALWSDNVISKYAQSLNRSTQERPTRLSVLFNSTSKEKQTTNRENAQTSID